MNYFDPKAEQYRKSGKNRRKFDDPNYKGPERRKGRRRKKTIDQIINRLEEQLEEKK